MKKLLISSILIGLSMLSVSAQNETAATLKTEVVKFAKSYDQAIVENDTVFLEEHLGADFFSISSNSYMMSRAKVLENAIKAKKDKKVHIYDVSDLESKYFDIKVSGNLVVVTSGWRVTRTSTTAINATPQVHTGTTTAVFRKTDKWELLSEHVAFDMPKTKDLVAPIGAASQRYTQMLINNNVADISKILAENYVRNVPSEQIRDKTLFIKDLRESKLTFKKIQSPGFYVNVAGGNAIETGEVIIEGGRPGEPTFTDTYEYTRTWVKRDDEWKITTEQFTLIKKTP